MYFFSCSFANRCLNLLNGYFSLLGFATRSTDSLPCGWANQMSCLVLGNLPPIPLSLRSFLIFRCVRSWLDELEFSWLSDLINLRLVSDFARCKFLCNHAGTEGDSVSRTLQVSERAHFYLIFTLWTINRYFVIINSSIRRVLENYSKPDDIRL